MIKVITDNKIKDCSQCLLKPTYTHDCGKITKVRGSSGSLSNGKAPDDRCKLETVRAVKLNGTVRE